MATTEGEHALRIASSPASLASVRAVPTKHGESLDEVAGMWSANEAPKKTGTHTVSS